MKLLNAGYEVEEGEKVSVRELVIFSGQIAVRCIRMVELKPGKWELLCDVEYPPFVKVKNLFLGLQ